MAFYMSYYEMYFFNFFKFIFFFCNNFNINIFTEYGLLSLPRSLYNVGDQILLDKIYTFMYVRVCV